jgi:uncharacterized cysteine cluster protein YcgN (CxxCxxCC family)
VKLTPESVRNLPWLHGKCGYIKALGLKKSLSLIP